MNFFDGVKVLKDHKKKSNQVKRLQKKLKNIKKGTTFIPVSKLQSMLAREKSITLDYRDYYSWGEYHDDSYARDSAKIDARIELLEELIRSVERG